MAESQKLERSSSSDGMLDTSDFGENNELLNESTIAPPVPSASLPWRVVIPLCLLQLVEAFNSNSIFSYVGYMILDFHLVNSENPQNGVGYFAGFLGGSFYFGQLCSSFAWGYLADRFGKRPTLLLGSLGTLISCLCFGFSFSFWFAMLARFLGGVLNGNIGIAKAYLGLVSTKETQAQAFGLIGLSWGVGNLIGSFYGGMLARPAVQWPNVFSNTIFARFPYLLPNLITAFSIAVAIVTSYVFLTEPVAKKKQNRPPSITAVFRNRMAVLTTVLYAIMGFGATMMDELLPVWSISLPSVGGLSFSTSDTGMVNGLTGVASIAVLLTIYNPIARRIGMIRALQLGTIAFFPCALAYPSLNLVLPMGKIILWLAVGLVCVLRAFAGQFAFSSIMALITNSVPPDEMGAAHGLGQSLVALCRSIAPVVAGSMYAWSVAVERPFPLDSWMSYFAVMLVFALLLGLSFLMSPSLDAPKIVEEVEMGQIGNISSDDLEEGLHDDDTLSSAKEEDYDMQLTDDSLNMEKNPDSD